VPFLDYDAVVPIADITESLPALQRAAAWRDSVR
jgi:hypothetical protein